MASYTLLELTQRILEAMDSEEVNSISDTVESTAVANIIEENYWTIINSSDSQDEFTLFELEASGDNTKPTLMTLPTDIYKPEWVKYNVRDTNDDHDIFEIIKEEDLGTFLNRIHAEDTSDANVGSFDHTLNGDSITFMYINDKAPEYYTILEGDIFIFDSYDSVVDTTLQKTKTMCYGQVERAFTQSDSFVVPFDRRQTMWLLNESKAQAFAELKQSQNRNAIMKARKQKIASHRNFDRSHALSPLDRIRRYGKLT